MAQRTFVEFEQDGVTVRSLFPWTVDDHDPQFEPDLPQPMDVTARDPLPVSGSVYDAEADTFTAPAPPAAPVGGT